MNSKVLDTQEIKEKYTTTNGANKTRVHTIRSMDNNGSKFINYRCGRQSVNISQSAWEQIKEVQLNWDVSKEQQEQDTVHQENVQLQRQINELKKLIQKASGKNAKK